MLFDELDGMLCGILYYDCFLITVSAVLRMSYNYLMSPFSCSSRNHWKWGPTDRRKWCNLNLLLWPWCIFCGVAR